MVHSTIDFLLLISVLAALVEGGDLFLRDHQKEKSAR